MSEEDLAIEFGILYYSLDRAYGIPEYEEYPNLEHIRQGRKRVCYHSGEAVDNSYRDDAQAIMDFARRWTPALLSESEIDEVIRALLEMIDSSYVTSREAIIEGMADQYFDMMWGQIRCWETCEQEAKRDYHDLFDYTEGHYLKEFEAYMDGDSDSE